MKYITDVPVEETVKKIGRITNAHYSKKEKNHILNYLKQFDASLFTSTPVIDVLSGEQVYDADNGYTDGTYTWYQSEIYYFERYDLALSPDFIDHIAKQTV